MEGKRIQFGHTQGLLILTLGVLLVTFQVLLSFHVSSGSAHGGIDPNAALSQDRHPLFFIPGIAGVITVGIGCYFLLQDRFKARSVRPPAKTKSGFPM